jgi:hypothetical protein
MLTFGLAQGDRHQHINSPMILECELK